MKSDWLIIPEFENLQESVDLADQFAAGFEYNDFYLPQVYGDKQEVDRRIAGYLSVHRDRSHDTLHGVFMDLAATSYDRYLREYSCSLIRGSMEIGSRLGVRGVVFHTGLVPGVEGETYLQNWADRQEEMWRKIAGEYPDVDIYLENTTERTPDCLVGLAERLRDVKQFGLCLDYAHAILTNAEPENWVSKMAPYVVHMHVNDNDLCRDLHQVPGDGKIDYAVMKNLLERYRINTPILLELKGVDAQRRALTYMTEL